MADAMSTPALSNIRTREREARTISALGAARNKDTTKIDSIVGSGGGK